MEAIGSRSLPFAPGTVLAAALVTVLAVFVAWPVLGLLAPALGPRAPGELLVGLATSAGVALAVTVATVPLATALAYLAARAPGTASRALVAAMAIPLVVPPFAAALALRFALDAVGGAPTTVAGGMLAVAAAQIVTLVPHAFAIMRNAMRRIDVDLEDAAVSLGAVPVTALARVTLVLVRPGIRCASLAVLALALADVASPLAIGGAAPFLSAQVVAAARRGDVAPAAAAALVLAVPCLIAWLAAVRAGWTRLGGLPLHDVTGRPAATAVRSGVAGAAMVAATVLLVALYALVPAASMQASEGWPLERPGASLRVMLAVPILATILAFALAVVAVRLPMRTARALGWSAFAAAGLPGVVVGLGYAVTLAVVSPPAALWIPIVALATWKLPTAVVLLTRRLRAHDPALEEVAVSLGAGNVTIARRIVAPLVAPALAAAFLDVLVQALTSASLLLVLAPGVSASATGLGRVAGGDVAGSASLVTDVAVVTVVVVLIRAWLAPREPLALLPA